MDDPAAGLFAGFFVILVMVLAVGGFVFWIVALVDCVRIEENVYRAAGTEKVTWVLIVALAGWIGALIYWFSPRSRLKEIDESGMAGSFHSWVAPHPGYTAPPSAPPVTPAGWYPDPHGAGLRWWDGWRWTEHVSDRPAP